MEIRSNRRRYLALTGVVILSLGTTGPHAFAEDRATCLNQHLAAMAEPDGASLRASTYGPTDEEAKVLAENNANLLALARQDPEIAAKLNDNVLTRLAEEPIPQGLSRQKPAFSQSEIDQLYSDAKENKQVRDSACSGKYNGSPDYGFCYGRAVVVHLKALQQGVSNQSVRKLWAVGALKSGGTSWRYHVTTIVRADDGNWFAVDPIFKKPMTASEWYSTVKRQLDPTGTMRIFSTPASRLGVNAIDKYNKAVLANEYFYGFFVDLLDTISRESTGKGGTWASIKSRQDRIWFAQKLAKRMGWAAGVGTLALIEVRLFQAFTNHQSSGPSGVTASTGTPDR